MARPEPLVAALLLAAVYALGGRLRDSEAALWSRRRWISAASGAAVAYVFVDILPELGVRHRAFVESAGAGLPFAEQRIYLAALAGFVVFYGLEHMVLASRAGGRVDAGGGAGDVVYWLHAGGFAAYSWLIGYLLVERAAAGRLALLLYGVAMTFHFLVVDHSLREEHGRAYDHAGRWALAASVVAGCLVGATTELSETVLSRLFAFVAGGVVITSVKAEMPHDREGRFWPFCLGALAYALLLLLA